MAKRPPRSRAHWTAADDKRMRQWRGCGVLAAVMVAGVVAISLTVHFLRKESTADEDHHHLPAPHGGVVVSVGDDEAHYHVEAVVEKGGLLTLYTFGGDTDQLLEIETQTSTARVKREGDSEFTVVHLLPMPRMGDAEGKTSRFVATLPEELRNEPLSVAVPGITILGKQYRLEFSTARDPHEDGDGPIHRDDEEKLFLAAGGKYTEDDIRANGNTTASRKYAGFKSHHDTRPGPGERICPVTRTKANAACTWTVSGKSYEFCCPPCIGEFVRRAKEEPHTIKEPEDYVKK